MRYQLFLILISLFCKSYAADSSSGKVYLGSREGDPESLVENVSTIHGDYSEYEIDLIIPGPDPLYLSRFYSSQDHLLPNSLGGWRFTPHCFLYIQKEARSKTYTTAEGKFDYTHILIGTNEGSVLTYAGWKNTTNPHARSLFKVDVEGSLLGLANTARGNINAWTNLKNNQLYFDAQTGCYELTLSSGGKRLYAPSLSTSDLYLLQVETLPSGNKIFYEYKGTALSQIKMTNASEEKILSWIRIQYGPVIHIDTSDGKTVDYHLQQDPPLLSEVIQSDKPPLKYQYRIVDDHPLLIKKDLPEGRFVEIDYYSDEENKNKVESVTTPAGISGMTSTRFTYITEEDGSGFTQVDGPLTRKSIYRFDDQLQLTATEQYLSGELYRVHKKTWGKRQTAGNIIATSVEDGCGAVYYFKSFAYDDNGNIVEEKEYGNLTGTHSQPLRLDEDGVPIPTQESHAKTYSYRTVKDLDIVSQKDPKGSSVKLFYKSGMTFGSGGVAAPLGWPVMAHGLDQFFTGMNAVFTGRLEGSVTSQLLQEAGLSTYAAGLIDNSLSIAGSMGGIASIRAGQLPAFPSLGLNDVFQVPRSANSWPSASGGRQVINDIEYTTHALERMSPRGLIQKGTEIVSRGVPPSVVENAIKFGVKIPGNTPGEIVHVFENVRVVTTSDTSRVITVITAGR